MDETQRRKIDIRMGVKNFLHENKKIGFVVFAIFSSLFVIYLALLFFFSGANDMSAVAQNEAGNESRGGDNQTFIERLFPTFGENEIPNQYDENGLPIIRSATETLENLTNNSSNGIFGTGEGGDADAIEIDKGPILAYTVFDKPISIKKYIKNKPKNCLEKVSVVLKKDEKGKAVENFQNTLRSIEGFDTLETTGVLDENTRGQIYVFQKRYAEILYKNKSKKEPTRLIDKETTHFLNLLCAFDKEEASDYINIPTLRYAKKSTREIFDYQTDTKEKVSLNNKFATGTQEAVFSESGAFVVFRSEGRDLSKITNGKDSRGQIISEIISLNNSNRVVLEKNITTLNFNKQNILVYGVPNDISMTIKLYDPVKNEVKRIAEIPMKEWNVFWLGDGSTGEIGIYNKPSAFAEGIFMTLNINNRKIERKTTVQYGFNVSPTNFPDFSIASIGTRGSVKTVLINNKTKIIGDLGIQTFSEKCAKTIVYDGIFCAVPKSLQGSFSYPDDWYKGKFISEDVLIYKSIAGTTTKVISSFEKKPMSIIDLNVHQNGIFFLDEKTRSLYSIES